MTLRQFNQSLLYSVNSKRKFENTRSSLVRNQILIKTDLGLCYRDTHETGYRSLNIPKGETDYRYV